MHKYSPVSTIWFVYISTVSLFVLSCGEYVLFLFHIKKNLVNLVHHMGGTIRKDFSTKVTHLIAYATHGEKYRVCAFLHLFC